MIKKYNKNAINRHLVERIINFNDEVFLNMCRKNNLTREEGIQRIFEHEKKIVKKRIKPFPKNNDFQLDVIITPDDYLSQKVLERYIINKKAETFNLFQDDVIEIGNQINDLASTGTNMIIYDTGQNLKWIKEKAKQLKKQGYNSTLVLNDFSTIDSINLQTNAVLSGNKNGITSRKKMLDNHYVSYSEFNKTFNFDKDSFDTYEAYYSNDNLVKAIEVNSMAKNYGANMARYGINKMLQEVNFNEPNAVKFIENKQKYAQLKQRFRNKNQIKDIFRSKSMD